MANPIYRPVPSEQAGPAESVGVVSRSVLEEEILVEVEETLVADTRGEWTPSQVVDQRLDALLRAGRLGPAVGAEGRLSDVSRLRRIPENDSRPQVE